MSNRSKKGVKAASSSNLSDAGINAFSSAPSSSSAAHLFSRLSKKDPKTRLKAVLGLHEYPPDDVLPEWAHIYASLIIQDVDRQVRVEASRLLSHLALLAGKRIAPYLTLLIPPWHSIFNLINSRCSLIILFHLLGIFNHLILGNLNSKLSSPGISSSYFIF